MEVVDVKTRAKVILNEIMDQPPDDHDLTAIWCGQNKFVLGASWTTLEADGASGYASGVQTASRSLALTT